MQQPPPCFHAHCTQVMVDIFSLSTLQTLVYLCALKPYFKSKDSTSLICFHIYGTEDISDICPVYTSPTCNECHMDTNIPKMDMSG
uniref:Uncharacterized protein n=1 Tax=Arion vulgaris TaxID=1028688 RepID=A0A0B7B1D4_9EUPU